MQVYVGYSCQSRQEYATHCNKFETLSEPYRICSGRASLNKLTISSRTKADLDLRGNSSQSKQTCPKEDSVKTGSKKQVEGQALGPRSRKVCSLGGQQTLATLHRTVGVFDSNRLKRQVRKKSGSTWGKGGRADWEVSVLSRRASPTRTCRGQRAFLEQGSCRCFPACLRRDQLHHQRYVRIVGICSHDIGCRLQMTTISAAL